MSDKTCCYYSDNRVKEPIFTACQQVLTKIGLPIVCVSLRPIPGFADKNGDKALVLENRERSYPTMVRQIIMALEAAETKYVFFTENDVLYHKSHFDFTPPKDNIFYYNANVWRWKIWDDKAIRYKKMWPLSSLAVGREFVLDHYRMREHMIVDVWGLDEFRSREPRRARIWGYEPGTKQRRRGGLTDDVAESYYSELPNIDIRHARTFSRLKCTIDDFKNPPEDWEEIPVWEVPGWNLAEVFPGKLDYIREYCTQWDGGRRQ